MPAVNITGCVFTVCVKDFSRPIGNHGPQVITQRGEASSNVARTTAESP
jgi:hypothetical protein